MEYNFQELIKLKPSEEQLKRVRDGYAERVAKRGKEFAKQAYIPNSWYDRSYGP